MMSDANPTHAFRQLLTRSPARLDFLLIVGISLGLRMVLIIRNPAVYEFDAYIYLLGLSSEYPLFSGLIKILISAGLSVFMIRTIVAALGSVACFAFYLFAERLFGSRTAARIAALLMSIYPPFLTFSLVPYTETLFFLILFSGLWFFEKESKRGNSEYIGAGVLLGLACFTRYEALLLLPLIFISVIWHDRERIFQAQYRGRFFSLCLVFFSGPLLLLFYKYALSPHLTTYQSAWFRISLKEVVPFFQQLYRFAIATKVSSVSAVGPRLPFLVCSLGVALAVIGCIVTLAKERSRHLPYIVFIMLSLSVQLVPLYSYYLDYSGQIMALQRHGMVPVVFLLSYLAYGIDNLVPTRFWRRAGMSLVRTAMQVVLVLSLALVFCKGTAFLLGDYQKLYRNSYVHPTWIGKPGESRVGIIALISDKSLRVFLMGTGLNFYESPSFLALPPEQGEEFVKQSRAKYFFIEQQYSSAFSEFITRATSIKVKQLAAVGRWLSVYVREGM